MAIGDGLRRTEAQGVGGVRIGGQRPGIQSRHRIIPALQQLFGIDFQSLCRGCETILQIGQNLRLARRKSYPDDTLEDFALRIGVSRATLQRMEKGDLSVSLGKYFQAATLLGLDAPFHALLKPKQSLFDD